MLKKKALRRNRIALFLVAMLIFCVLGTDGIMACDAAQQSFGRIGETVLEYPGAGEFFTDSLPLGETQSVREMSADWQSIIVLRPGRATGIKNGSKLTGILTAGPNGFHGISVCGESPGENTGMPAVHCTEVIVRYIHNQDGAKG